MSQELTRDLESEVSSQILKKTSTGIALFNPEDFYMNWCNLTFKKQTWFGTAGKSSKKVNITDLFEEKDHKLIFDMINIAAELGQAYDFQRQVRRGPVGSFPAEIKFNKLVFGDGHVLICIEILDLSITKMYDELQETHAQMREKMADLMTAQAELQYSVRMNTISEIGADIAHQLINPITICRGILESQISPYLVTDEAIGDMDNALKYMKDIEELAVWFRKFSDPRLSSNVITNIMIMVNDALMLNVHRFTTQGITYKIRKDEEYDPHVIVNKAHFIMWLNTAFAELCNVIPKENSVINVDIHGHDEFVTVTVHCDVSFGKKNLINTETLEKFALKLAGIPRFEAVLKDSHALFSIGLNCFREEEETLEQQAGYEGAYQVSTDIPMMGERPIILVVDDEQDIRRLIKRAFKQANWDVIEAADGLQALDCFKQENKKNLGDRICAIVCDVRMPRMTGPHFLVALREEKIQTPFIFFSSNLVEQNNNGFRYENVFYLTKESGLDELKNLVSRCILKNTHSVL
jgi:CheY-like chemotaxis protein